MRNKFSSIALAHHLESAYTPHYFLVVVAKKIESKGMSDQGAFPLSAVEQFLEGAPLKGSAVLKMARIQTPVGVLTAVADEEALYLLEFEGGKRLRRMGVPMVSGKTGPIAQIERELGEYFQGRLREFKTPLLLVGSPFQKRVWEELRKIPRGETRSYAEVAVAIGKPTAFRAVALANGANPFVIVVPCHRVINSSGALGGYGGGIERKEWLLQHERVRCFGSGKELYADYHDREWGVPVHEDRLLFEMLVLEGAQAGLSWETVLKKRDEYRRVFYQFDPVQVAEMSDGELDLVLENPGVIRNRLKIYAVRQNARVFLQVQGEWGSFARYVWGFVGDKPVVTRRKSLKEVPVSTAVSEALSKDLQRRGMTFVGPTIMYAFMQAVGLVDDHLEGCWVGNRR